jgi:hypothetical protein
MNKSPLSVICISFITAAFPLPAASQPQLAKIYEHFGNIEYSDPTGARRLLTSDHLSGLPTLSPDGRTAAWIHIDRLANRAAEQGDQTSVWIADAKTGAMRKLAGDSGDNNLENEIVNPQSAIFSLDGGYLYVTSELGAVTPGIHQIKISTDQRRFIINGTLIGVLRNGPYRGYLLVAQHSLYAPPKVGAYYAAYVINPDGKTIMMVPHSDDEHNPNAVTNWLTANNWLAW